MTLEWNSFIILHIVNISNSASREASRGWPVGTRHQHHHSRPPRGGGRRSAHMQGTWW